MSQEKREHFRIIYPPSVQPTVLIEGTWYKVVDLAEQGIKIAVSTTAKPRLRPKVKGTLKFADGEIYDIEGQLLRDLGDELVLVLTKGVPLSKIMSEQRMLINKFKRF